MSMHGGGKERGSRPGGGAIILFCPATVLGAVIL